MDILAQYADYINETDRIIQAHDDRSDMMSLESDQRPNLAHSDSSVDRSACFVPRQSIWQQIKACLQPAEVPEVQRILGAEMIEKNEVSVLICAEC